jgi:hypothetical protein
MQTEVPTDKVSVFSCDGRANSRARIVPDPGGEQNGLWAIGNRCDHLLAGLSLFSGAASGNRK